MEINLKGSPKQIAWAKDIIAAAQHHIDNAMNAVEIYYPYVDCAIEAAEKGQEALEKFVEKTVYAAEIIDKRQTLYDFYKLIDTKRSQLIKAKEAAEDAEKAEEVKAAEAKKAEKKAELEAKKAAIKAAEDAESEEQKREEYARRDALQNRIDAPDTESEIAYVRSLFADTKAVSDKQLAYADLIASNFELPAEPEAKAEESEDTTAESEIAAASIFTDMKGTEAEKAAAEEIISQNLTAISKAIRTIRGIERGDFDEEIKNYIAEGECLNRESAIEHIMDDTHQPEAFTMIASRLSAADVISAAKTPAPSLYKALRDSGFAFTS